MALFLKMTYTTLAGSIVLYSNVLGTNNFFFVYLQIGILWLKNFAYFCIEKPLISVSKSPSKFAKSVSALSTSSLLKLGPGVSVSGQVAIRESRPFKDDRRPAGIWQVRAVSVGRRQGRRHTCCCFASVSA